jgi:hypothetical protein
MTIAELRGKLSPDTADERSEDLLTSDVFGTMRYLNGGGGFLEWLASAVTPLGAQARYSRLGEMMSPEDVIGIHIAFWPALPNRREPDVVVLVSRRHSDPLLLCIEVKYLSGMSDFEVNEADERQLTGNQIADQVQGLTHLTPHITEQWFPQASRTTPIHIAHILVTTESRLPKAVYDAAAQHFGGTWPCAVFWVSWSSLSQFLWRAPRSSDKGRVAMIEDLTELLERKGLAPFHGIRPLDFEDRPLATRFWEERWWRVLLARPSQSLTFWTDV